MRSHPDYEASLHALVDRGGVRDYITFLAQVSKDEMPSLLQQFDVLIFPSIYEEPLARVLQEAMVSGLVVVGTTTGGTTEILTDGKTGLTFAPGDADALAAQVTRLVTDPDLCRRLAKAGRQVVLEYFNLDRMVDEIEDALQEVMACFDRDSVR